MIVNQIEIIFLTNRILGRLNSWIFDSRKGSELDF